MTLRVAICVPSMGTWTSKTAWCVAKAVDCFNAAEYDGGEKTVDVLSVVGSNLLEVRQKLVAEAWRMDATHMLWVDSDMYFPHDTIQRLLSHGKPVVAANYVRKQLPTFGTAYQDDDTRVGPVVTKDDSEGLIQVKHCGLGLMLVDMDVYERIELPFFNFEPIAPHNVQWVSEDTYFCRKLEKAGVPIYVDQDISRLVEHVGQIGYSHTMATASTEAKLHVYETKKAEDRKKAAEEIKAHLAKRAAE